jgi:REP element-mobilizing transposase RayT
MARPLRDDVAGIHHVYARGNDRARIFRTDEDREDYLRLLGRVTVRKRWRCLAYCLMDNHVHLLIETREPNLANGMQRLHGCYAQAYNERYARRGHLFQGRYGSRPIKSDEQLWATIAYIAHNPVEAGMCDSPERYRWSSHPRIVRGRAPGWLDERRLLERFEEVGGDPRLRYSELIDGLTAVTRARRS